MEIKDSTTYHTTLLSDTQFTQDVSALCSDQKLFLQNFVKELSHNVIADSFINLDTSADGYFVVQKDFLMDLLTNNDFPASHPIWKRLARSSRKSTKLLYRKYKAILKRLQLGTTKKNSFKQEASRNSCMGQSDENKVFCVCGEPWKGEFMIECDCCRKWFHPGCLSGKQKSFVIEYYNDFVLCVSCKALHRGIGQLAQLSALKETTNPSNNKKKRIRKNPQANESTTAKSFILENELKPTRRPQRKRKKSSIDSTIAEMTRVIERD